MASVSVVSIVYRASQGNVCYTFELRLIELTDPAEYALNELDQIHAHCVLYEVSFVADRNMRCFIYSCSL